MSQWGPQSGYGMGEKLADLASHRTIDDTVGTIFVLGLVVIVPSIVAMAAILSSRGFNIDLLFPVAAIAVFGLIFLMAGILMRVARNKERH